MCNRKLRSKSTMPLHADAIASCSIVAFGIKPAPLCPQFAMFLAIASEKNRSLFYYAYLVTRHVVSKQRAPTCNAAQRCIASLSLQRARKSPLQPSLSTATTASKKNASSAVRRVKGICLKCNNPRETTLMRLRRENGNDDA